jgi:hypothetical protein
MRWKILKLRLRKKIELSLIKLILLFRNKENYVKKNIKNFILII